MNIYQQKEFGWMKSSFQKIGINKVRVALGKMILIVVVVVVLLFYVHDKHLRSCRDGQLT